MCHICGIHSGGEFFFGTKMYKVLIVYFFFLLIKDRKKRKIKSCGHLEDVGLDGEWY